MSNATGKLVGLRLAFITCFVPALPSLGYLLSFLSALILGDLNKLISLLPQLWALLTPEFFLIPGADLKNMFCSNLRSFVFFFMPVGFIFYTIAWVALRFGFTSVLPGSSRLVDIIISIVYALGLLALLIRSARPLEFDVLTLSFFNQPVYSMADFGLNAGFLERFYCIMGRYPLDGRVSYVVLLTAHLTATTLLSYLMYRAYSRSGEKLFLIPAVLAIIVHIPRLPLAWHIIAVYGLGYRADEIEYIRVALISGISSLISLLFSWAFYWIPLGIAFLRVYRRVAVKPSG